MDIATLSETLTPVALGYFLAGVVAGYLLKVYSGKFENKRPGRYESIKTHGSAKRSSQVEMDDPAFELPDSVLKTLSPNRLSRIGIDENINEF